MIIKCALRSREGRWTIDERRGTRDERQGLENWRGKHCAGMTIFNRFLNFARNDKVMMRRPFGKLRAGVPATAKQAMEGRRPAVPPQADFIPRRAKYRELVGKAHPTFLVIRETGEQEEGYQKSRESEGRKTGKQVIRNQGSRLSGSRKPRYQGTGYRRLAGQALRGNDNCSIDSSAPSTMLPTSP